MSVPAVSINDVHHPWRRLRDEYPDWIVVWCELEHDLAHADWDAKAIYMDRRLSQAERRSTVAHELFHLDRGPAPLDPRLLAREEAIVEQLAARALIPIPELGEALAWSYALDEAAAELWVDRNLLEARLAHLHPAERHYLRRRLTDPHDEETHAHA